MGNFQRIQFMTEPVLIRAATRQDVRLAVMTGPFHEVEVTARLLGLEGSASGSITLYLETGMQTDFARTDASQTPDNGWERWDSTGFDLGSTAPGFKRRTLTNPSLYTIWCVPDIKGTTSITLWLEGIGRTF